MSTTNTACSEPLRLLLFGLLAAGVAAAGDVEPPGWFTGDVHVHRGICCGRSDAASMLTPADLRRMMEPNRLNVVSVLSDMGNGECRDAAEDFPLIGRDHAASGPNRILHWDAEWHFDPAGVTFNQKAIGGHLVVLGLESGKTIFRETTHPIIEWAQRQGAVVGFLHMQYLKDDIPSKLDCCAPLEYPVEVALTPGVFLVEDVLGSDSAMRAYYRLLNCGFRPGIAAGTDYPCCEKRLVPLGDLLTYVNIPDGKLTYRKWIDGIAAGRTVVSRNAHNEFLDLRVNGAAPGGEVYLAQPGRVNVEIHWTARQPFTGSIEIVQDGVVVSTSRQPRVSVSIDVKRSSWIAARRMSDKGHQTHTAAIFLTVNRQPIPPNAEDAAFFVRFIDNLIARTSPGGEWAAYLPTEREAAHARYRAARAIYARMASSSASNTVSTSVLARISEPPSTMGSVTGSRRKATASSAMKNGSR